MKAGSIMKEALEAVLGAPCVHEGSGDCGCCRPVGKAANEGLAGLDDATVARMDWVAELESQDLARIVKALELAEEASDRFGQPQESGALRDLRSGLEDLS